MATRKPQMAVAIVLCLVLLHIGVCYPFVGRQKSHTRSIRVAPNGPSDRDAEGNDHYYSRSMGHSPRKRQVGSNLFPFGEGENDESVPPEDDGATEVQIQPFPFFGRNETATFINTNGIISFQSAFPSFFPRSFSLVGTTPLIAPFWDDVDIRRFGSVYYRETTSTTLLERARDLICAAFTAVTSFTPTSLFIATWDRVAEFGGGTEENTFQVVMATDGQLSFVLLIYGDIQWIHRRSNIGFNGDGTRFFMVPGALTADAINIETGSNVGLPGLYIYRVDQTQILEPDDVVTTARLEQRSYTVDEDAGSLEVCVISEENEIAQVTLNSADARTNQALGGIDYIAFTEILDIPPLGRECINITILDDALAESREQFIVQLNSTLLVPYTVYIEDNDNVLLTLEQESYTVSESDGYVEVCVAAQRGDETRTAVAILFTQELSELNSAAAGTDFGGTNQILTLAGGAQQCVNISILDDEVPELPQEQFRIRLNTQIDTDLGIDEATVVIVDDDQPTCIPECQNGACMIPGVCVCDPGWTGFACEIALPCPLLTTPDHGTIECTPPSQTVGSNCTFSCNGGYSLNGSASLLCQISATWTGEVPTCEPKLCEPLEPPQNGTIHLPCNRVFTTSCTIHCMGGFRINGSAQQRCVFDPDSGEVVWTDPPVCEDVNECELGTHNCSNDVPPPLCENTVGGFRCSCDEYPGFKLNETEYPSCEDINECETGAHNCSDRGDAPAQCINTVGGFGCSCDIGFMFNSSDATCQDSNECREGISGCNHRCRNTIGSFTCSCFRGYILNMTNLRICEDINECLENNGGCISPARCVNLPGRHECECPRGYSLDHSRQGCEALQCPRLTAPQNGSIDCNPSEQRVGALCTFMCDQGYDLTGSQMRNCRSSATWSGQPTICEPQHCTQLQPSDNGFVLLPCTGAYSTSCSIECREGYRINGTTPFQQMCVLDDGELRWTDPPVCSESNICDPNCCKHGGICSPFGTSSFSCDCEGTGYIGPTCNTGIITVSPIPNLNQNMTSENISISANPDRELEISVDGGDHVVVNPRTVRITPPAITAYFNITATQSGILSLRYAISGPGATNFLAPPESPAFVMEETPTGGHVEFQYFRQIYGGINPGNIFEGCCSHEDLFFQCPMSNLSNRVTFRAGCIWNSDGMNYSTSGLVFVANQNFTMPLSVAGVTVTADGSLITASLPEFQPGNCIPCKNNQPCSPDTRCTADSCCCYDFTNSDTIDFLESQSLAFTSRSHIQSLLPPWVQRLSVRNIGRNNAIYEYISALTSAEMMSQLEGCEEIEANDEGLYLVFRYQGILEATIDSQRLFAFTEIPSCFAIDMCRHQSSPLFIQLSPVAHSVITSQFLREYTVARGWDITIKSILLSRVGLPPDFMTPDTYWNGFQFFQPRVQQQRYDIVMQTESQAFFSSHNLEIDLNFSGTAHYNYQERDGILDGELMMNVTTRIASGSASLILTNPSGLSVVNINEGQQLSEDRSTQPSEVANQTGITFKLNIRQRREQLFYRKLFFFPEETTECPVDAFMNLNDNLELQSFSFHTTCPHLSLGRLTFTGMAHTLCFSGNDYPQFCLGNRSMNVPDQASLVILSTLQGQRLPLGRFFTLLPDTESDSIALSVIYLREDPTPVARLHKVRVSLLESSFSTSMKISDNNLRFMAESEIRGLYPADLTVSAPVNETTWDRLPLSVSGTMKGGQNSFIQRLQEALDDSVQEVAVGAFRRELLLNQTRQRSQTQFLQLETRFNESRLEVAAANRTYQEKLAQVDAAIVTLGQVEETLANASTELRELREETSRLCVEQECEETCANTTMMCMTCYIQTFTEQTGRCTYNANENRTIRVPPFFEERRVWRWIQSCRPLQLSRCSTDDCQMGRDEVCYGRCVPVLVQEPVYNYRNIIVSVQRVRSCTVMVYNGTVPRQCCLEVACPVRRPNSTCNDMNSACRQVRQMAYNTRQELAGPLRSVDEARLQLTLARSEVSRAKVLLDAAQQKLSQITPAYESSREANELSEVSYRMALADLEAESQVLKLLQTYNRGLLTVINTTFDITIVSESPLQLPVLITYTSMHDGRILQRMEELGLTAPEQALRGIFRRIAKDIVDYTLLNTSRISKRSVNLLNRLKRQEAEQDENRLRFEENCADLQNVDSFLNEIADSLFELNDSIANAQQTLADVSEADPNELDSEVFGAINLTVLETGFNVTISMEELQENVRNSEVNMAYAAIESEYKQQVDDLLEASYNNTFADWRARIDILYNQSNSFAEFPCFSFSDCLFTVVNVLERLVGATPGAVARRLESMLPSARDELLQLGTSMNLTVPEAAEKIRPILNILDEYNQINFWCSSPPEITLQPPTEVNVSANGTLSLTCEAESDLPITYQWRKDGGTIPGANSSHLGISNMQRLDSGNYSCHVSNAVGTIPSINTSVLVYELPQFYLTLVQTSVYEGDDDGAWFACNATAWPFPGWRWYFRPSEGSQFTVIDGEDTNELLIPNPQKENEGWYTCEAFNGHGSIRDDPVFLRVLPVTVSQQAIPIQFQIVSDSPQVNNECDDMFLQIGVLSAIEELIDTQNNFVNDIEVREMSTTTYAVSFFLTSINVTGEDTRTITLTEIANRAVPTRVALQESQEAIENAIQRGELVVECETTFAAIPSSLAFQRLLYICPPGQQLISNYLLCVGCEPGSYSDVTEQTRVFSGEALTERIPVCRPCPIGTYEPRVGSSQCMSCPEFYTTASTGATSADECTVDPLLMECSASGTSERVVVSCRTNRPPITILCSFDGGLEHACELPISVTLLVFGGGNHSVRITAMDSIGFRAERNVHYFLQNDTRTNFFPEVPPLAIHLINDSPVIAGSTLKVDFVLTRPATSVTCQIRRNERQDCSSGSITFTDLEPGAYSLRIAASNSREDRAILRRRFEITYDPSLCILHLINDGVTVEDDRANVEFAGTGPAESFTCKLDNSPSFTCTTPVVLSDLQAGDHTLRIIPSGCGRNRRPLRVDFQV